MLQFFGALKSLVNLSQQVTNPETESIISKLHYRVTSIILLVCCVLVTCVEYVGNGLNIACTQSGHPDSWPIPQHVMNTYCYIMGTFTLPSLQDKEMIFPGVRPYNQQTEQNEVQYKAYYQWVPFVLFLQACIFYVPHALFKVCEGGKVASIISGLHQKETELSDEDRVGGHDKLAKYFLRSINTHNFWAARMLCCELITLVNIFFNIYFIDFFLGYEFSDYGLKVLTFVEDDFHNRIDPMSRVFPRMTKCLYKNYGPTGTIQTKDALCMLPINVINEKIYVFLWFWLVFLSILTLINMIYHLALILSPSTLSLMIKHKLRQRKVKTEEGLRDIFDDVTNRFMFGDWMLLNLLAYNMSPVILSEFILELNNQIRVKEDLEITEQNDSNANLRRPLLTPI